MGLAPLSFAGDAANLDIERGFAQLVEDLVMRDGAPKHTQPPLSDKRREKVCAARSILNLIADRWREQPKSRVMGTAEPTVWFG